MPRNIPLLSVALLLACTAALPAQSKQMVQSRPPRPGGGIDEFHSPAVFGAFEVWRSTRTTTHSLAILVLWRGSSGWLDQAVRNEGLKPGGLDRKQNVRLKLGRLDLDYGHDLEAGTVRFMGVTHQLNGANVVLIDSVDAPAGHQKVTLLRVDSLLQAVSMGHAVDSLIVHTPALLSFLDCKRSANTELLRKVVSQGVCGLPRN